MSAPIDAGAGSARAAMAAIQSRMDSVAARFQPRTSSTAFADQLHRFAGNSGWQSVRRAAGVGRGDAPESWHSLGTDGVSGQDVLSVGQNFLGVPYVWGGTDPSGFDCSGFTQYVYGQFGIQLPRVSRDQARAGEPVASLTTALPGDLVAFNTPVDHIGIYAGDGRMLVAPHSGDVVKLQTITEAPTAIRRILRQPSATTGGSGTAAAPLGTDLLASLLAERSRLGLDLGVDGAATTMLVEALS